MHVITELGSHEFFEEGRHGLPSWNEYLTKAVKVNGLPTFTDIYIFS